MPIQISTPSLDRFKEIAAFVSRCDVLVGHDPHFYKIVLNFFGDTALVAEDADGKACGWTFGFISQKEPDLFFLWQIGVDKSRRGDGIGAGLLAGLIDCARKKGCRRMRATVEPQNTASVKLFQRAGFDNISKSFGEARYYNDVPYLFDYYGESDDMTVFERQI